MANLGFGMTPIKPDDLLKLLEKQLKEAGQCTGAAPNPPGCGLGADAFLSLWTDDMHAKNPRGLKQFVAIRPSRFPVWQSVVQGAGHVVTGYTSPIGPLVNTATGFNGVVTLACFSQIASDPEMRSSDVLTADVLSVTQFVMRVIAAVQFWTPRDKDNNMLLREPGRMLDGGFGFRTVKPGDTWWNVSSIDLECKFTAKW